MESADVVRLAERVDRELPVALDLHGEGALIAAAVERLVEIGIAPDRGGGIVLHYFFCSVKRPRAVAALTAYTFCSFLFGLFLNCQHQNAKGSKQVFYAA